MAEKTPVILVTGSSRGLGKGIAVELAKSGYSVAINYTSNLQAAEDTLKECEQLATSGNQKFLTVKADIASKHDRNEMIETIIKDFGRLDGLVNNAGIAPKVRADITDATEESFEELLKINLQGPYFLTQKVAHYWLNEKPEALLMGGFKIVFVTSISAYAASVNRGDYCISKAGLSMATQLWASRLAGEGVQVIEMRPGIMKTDMTSGVISKYDALIKEGLIPQKRWGTPEDLGIAVASFMKGHFNFSTGTVIDVDGGFRIQRL